MNFLLLWTDQQRADSLSCLGGVPGLTPNLDRLASESTVFERAYCVQPVCTPSRATIMTGHWPHVHGCITNNVRLPAERPTIAERAGTNRDTGYFGKWHLGDELVPQRGFDDWLSIEDAIYRPFFTRPEYYELRSDYHQYLVSRGYEPDSKAADGAEVFSRQFAARLPERDTKAAFLGRSVAERLRERESDRPLLWSVNFFEPHTPFMGPLDDLLDRDALPVGPAFATPPADNHAWRNHEKARQVAAGKFEVVATDEAALRDVRARYLGLVKLVDNAVGEILDALRETGLLDETVVMFTSDHGEMAGDHNLLTKSVMYEEATRIPWMIRVPGQAPQRIAQPVSHIDLLPTALELMGETPPAELPGRSLAPVVRGAAPPQRDVVVQWNPSGGDDEMAQQSWRSLVSQDGYKLNVSDRDTPELFNLNDDPHELRNVVHEPGHALIVEAMYERLLAWQTAHADALVLRDPTMATR